MHSLKWIALCVCVLAIVPLAIGGNDLGIRDTAKVVFVAPMRVGEACWSVAE